MMESVRRAGLDDLDRCRELLEAARREVPRGTDRLPAIDPETWWLGDDRLLLVGLFAGAVVGLAAGQAEGGIGQVACCYVEPEAREVGVGGELLAGLLSWFADRGCTDVDALALPGDRSTKQMLETAGFKARLLVFHRPLP